MLGIDNVVIDLPVARVGSRILAATIDYTLLAILLLFWWLGGFFGAQFIGLSVAWTIGILLAGAFAIDYGFFALQELYGRGQTLGKRWLGLRVVSRLGGRADATQLVVRNLVRTVDVLIGALLMAIDPLARRLGDRIAGTLVIHERRAQTELIVSRVPTGWRRQEVEVIEAFLRRAPILEERERTRLASRLVEWVDQASPGFLPPTGEPRARLEEAFLAPPKSEPGE